MTLWENVAHTALWMGVAFAVGWVARALSAVRADLVQCDVCGRWGRPNLNYKGCDGRAFVHVSASGAQYVHPIHVVKSMMAQLREADSG
jgi:hypothetical protein